MNLKLERYIYTSEYDTGKHLNSYQNANLFSPWSGSGPHRPDLDMTKKFQNRQNPDPQQKQKLLSVQPWRFIMGKRLQLKSI
jgi:hypothetical protein